MAEPEELLDEFRAAYLAGEDADVTRYLERVTPARRQELARMLDSFLMGEKTRRRWNPDAYRGSLAEAAVERVYESTEGISGTWPELLPRLRTQARIKRSELVERLAAMLGFSEQGEVERVGGYYHRMEHGTLPAAGVSDRVIVALAEIVGEAAETIRRSGSTEFPHEGSAETAFARTGTPDPELSAELADARAEAARSKAAGDRDEIDRLFLDG